MLAAVNALGANQREMTQTLQRHETRLGSLEVKVDDTNTRVRSLEETTDEIKELLVRAKGANNIPLN